jgi:hypothetical protein
MIQPTCSSSSDIIIYFSTTTQPASQRKVESTSGRLRTGMTQDLDDYYVEDWFLEDRSRD